MDRKRQGLSKLSADLLAKASDETATQVNRILLTFVGTTIFCLLSLLTPDSALLAGSEKLNVPFAGPVSFLGFIILGPAILIVLRTYLQIYVEHSHRLARLAQRMPAARAPTLIPLENPLMRVFSGFAFYLLLPLAMLMFAWKAAVFARWGAGLLCVAAAVTVIHLMLPIRRTPAGTFSWPSKVFVSIGAAFIVLVVLVRVEKPLSRPFDLTHANLSDQSLRGADLGRAVLFRANLARAYLPDAYLKDADLIGADLRDAELRNADLRGATIGEADLRGADFMRANLTGAKLMSAKLTGAKLWSADLMIADLRGADLSGANLSAARFAGAVLNGADLSRADLSGADFVGANLTGAKFISAKLTGAKLLNANFTGADLKDADLRGTSLSHANGLVQNQLDETCRDEKTELPPNLNPAMRCRIQ
jgi:uncharacterized protein YjbI with pentapeptide repeats